jgi:RNA polymerase sigma factor (sigma-70 family)
MSGPGEEGDMKDRDWLAERFEEHRTRLRAVAYRMLGSVSEADDAVQDAWLRVSRADAGRIDNLGGWLTTVVARASLDMLRARASRREAPMDPHVPDPVVTLDAEADPEHRAVLADSVGLAVLVVLETLTPAERLAIVLHDMFAVPFEEIAPIVGRSPTAARQLASRARRRVRGAATASAPDLARQRKIVDAFVAASRDGDFETLLAILDPDMVLRLDRGAAPAGASRVVRGASGVVELGFRFSGDGWVAQPAVVNGAAGLVVTHDQRAFAVIGFTVVDDRITRIDILADPARIRRLRLETAGN